MHISEGVLSAPVLITGGALTMTGTFIGLKKIDYDRIMTASLLTATFFVALFLQALFFNFGGLVVLGVNTVNMALLPPLICYYLFRGWVAQNGTKRKIGAFGAGFLSILLSALMMALALSTTDGRFIHVARMVVLAHVPVMIIEGFITMFTVTFLAKVQPEFLGMQTP